MLKPQEDPLARFWTASVEWWEGIHKSAFRTVGSIRVQRQTNRELIQWMQCSFSASLWTKMLRTSQYAHCSKRSPGSYYHTTNVKMLLLVGSQISSGRFTWRCSFPDTCRWVICHLPLSPDRGGWREKVTALGMNAGWEWNSQRGCIVLRQRIYSKQLI